MHNFHGTFAVFLPWALITMMFSQELIRVILASGSSCLIIYWLFTSVVRWDKEWTGICSTEIMVLFCLIPVSFSENFSSLLNFLWRVWAFITYINSVRTICAIKYDFSLTAVIAFNQQNVTKVFFTIKLFWNVPWQIKCSAAHCFKNLPWFSCHWKIRISY